MTMVHIAIDLQDESEVERVLSLLNQEHVPHRVERKNVLSDEERAAARERIMRGAPTLNVDEMLEWLKESKKDRKLPFRDDDE
ncbi:hypothetical protein J2I47_08360 [Fibrella sp. HMF5335]|uniref:Uncharacterized protein n=1 Tax=Fibrella rubiginis TaxID=2817060 RepID=A0A939GCH9_9BACT|nr:hypothetical protein [Fibrella rubiginis]MBO0936552.1 hypothetical protein [Fibrella rubiginis]